jgi:hypothetical protein
MAQLPPVLVCGMAVLVELELEPELDDDVDEPDVLPLEYPSSLEVEPVLDDELSPDEEVAAVTCLVVLVPVSLHAIAPPSERAAAMLKPAAARRARRARGGLRSGPIGGSFGASIWTHRRDPK